jgi:hypothetical protein
MGGGTSAGGGAAAGGGTSAGGGTGTGGGSADAGCQSSWFCGLWQYSLPSDGGASRQCFDSNSCMPATNVPVLAAKMPPLDFPFFQCRVEPVLAKNCGMVGCHGTPPARGNLIVYSRGRGRHSESVTMDLTAFGCETGTHTFDLATEASATGSCRGLIPLTQTEWSIDYDNARAFDFDTSGGQNPYLTNLDSSQLLNDLLRGTLAHANAKTWASRSDPDYDTIKQWLDGGTMSPTCNMGTNN